MAPRIVVITQRDVSLGTGRQVAYGTWSEAEDILIETSDSDLVRLSMPIEHPRIRVRRSLGRTWRHVRGPTGRLPGLIGSNDPSRALSGRYDVAVFVAFATWDLQLLERLRALRSHADRVVVWFFETWPSSYGDGRVAFEPFHAVDDIFVGLEGAVDPLAETTGREVTYLPMATDTLRFSPERPDTERPVDLIGIGRRRPEQHEAMLGWAAERDRFYLYDTAMIDRPRDYRRHRDTIGRWYANSKLTVCNFGKSDMPELIGDLRTIPGRLWEGLASGAGMVGHPPDESMQRLVLGRTVVEPMPEGPEDLAIFLEDMIERHDSVQAAANIRLALTGHDWAHRWVALFEHLDMEAPIGLQQRVVDLSRRAEKFL